MRKRGEELKLVLAVKRDKMPPRVKKKRKRLRKETMERRKSLRKRMLKAAKKAQQVKVTQRTIGLKLMRDNLSRWLKMRQILMMSSHHLT